MNKNHCNICLKEFDTVQDYCASCWVKVKARRMRMGAIVREQRAKRLAEYPEIVRVLKGGM